MVLFLIGWVLFIFAIAMFAPAVLDRIFLLQSASFFVQYQLTESKGSPSNSINKMSSPFISRCKVLLRKTPIAGVT
ncbi:hypothetical protein AND4_10739 [Vibrio sp. AND4]|nr:hypothetical protein AND4_10739 [Vibrio sp. AND4]